MVKTAGLKKMPGQVCSDESRAAENYTTTHDMPLKCAILIYGIGILNSLFDPQFKRPEPAYHEADPGPVGVIIRDVVIIVDPAVTGIDR